VRRGWTRTALPILFVVGVAVAFVARTRRRAHRPTVDDEPWAPRPASAPPMPAWVAPVDRACPTSHPIKAKDSSGIYHVPGGVSYARTVPDRCYCDEAAAEADGFVKSRR
jgi:hypothetical protein